MFLMQVPLQMLKSRGIYTAGYQTAKGLILCVVMEHTHIHTPPQPISLEEFVLEDAWLFHCLPVAGTSHGAFHWSPVTERASRVGT